MLHHNSRALSPIGILIGVILVLIGLANLFASVYLEMVLSSFGMSSWPVTLGMAIGALFIAAGVLIAWRF